jgi:hypothetical protein
MKNIFKGIVNKVFGKEKTKEETENEVTDKGPIIPGLDETSEDVGKKVFEKTGRIREGVGQSSTVEPHEAEDKAKGIKRPEKKPYLGRKHKEKK